ncbi:probable cytochrome P450 6a19 [Drosophila rhopaloa]|uniref:Cytochrome P450 6a20 n=1 Tax=Drosophila rhopaloa TaxID=1041015 RepID=A0ABM5H3X9_DRORH|nr:probable cytochrome P450 6a19 [Drosophila rhopaloa]
MAVLLGLLVGALTLAVWWVLQNYTYWKRRGIPHDPPNIPLGNSREFWRTMQLAEIIKRSYLKFKNQTDGPFVGFYLYARKYIVVTDIDFVKTVLVSDFDKFHDRGVYHNERDDPLTSNLTTMEGQKWRNLRQKLTPAFTPAKVKTMFPAVLNVAHELIRVIDEKISSSPQTLEVSDLMARFTADVIGTCAFGLECNSLRDPKAEFVQMGNAALRERRHGWLVDLLIFGAPKIAVMLGIELLLPSVQKFYMNIVRNTIDYRVENKITRNDFLDLLIDMKLKYDKGDKQNGLSFNEIAAQVYSFFLAGFETSSTTMGFALYELSCNQDVQDKLRMEVDTVLKKHDGQLDYNSMREMSYMEKVIDETLRKYPVLGFLVRIATKPYVHSSPKYFIEPGTGVMVSNLGIHHDPDFYPEPEKFIPERFDEEQVKKRPPCTFLPFGDGPRNCIGLRFGRMQVFVGLALLIHNFKFELHPTKTSVLVNFKVKNILLSSEDGFNLNVSKVVKV